MRPVQLIPEESAVPTSIARDVPTYRPGPCDGCRFVRMCRDRGQATVFFVKEPRGAPVYCQQIGAHLVPCLADHMPDMEPRTRVPRELPWYLVDASVFINAVRWNWAQCKQVIQGAGAYYHLATTNLVFQELLHSYTLPVTLTVVDIDPSDIDPRVLEVAKANRGQDDPTDRASRADLSLVQAVLDDPRFKGIITEDDDLVRLHVRSLVRKLEKRVARVYRSEEFVTKHPGWF